ncbi:MAG: HAMP domain-containing sensor histidine kinase [Gammaproteobacteria bacterium]|nr:HAMP domain-containing sensor histidine kinase [Gammaproteobacteria bacterium]
MIDFDQVAEGLSDNRELIGDLSTTILEQTAQLADHHINDLLLAELMQHFVEAERHLTKLNDLKNKFLGIAAHDLRNPLTTIRGMSQMLLEMDDLEEETRASFLKTISEVSDEMFNLINNLLDVSVIESGQFDLQQVKTDISSLARSRIDLITLTARKKGIDLEIDLGVVPQVMIDPNRMGQVINNLLTNALKFSEPGTIVKLVIAHRHEQVVIEVKDQGQGISAEEQDLLFGTFQKLSARPTGDERSTGLGLSIVKKIVDAHGGQISVNSEVGQGSTFSVALPVV